MFRTNHFRLCAFAWTVHNKALFPVLVSQSTRLSLAMDLLVKALPDRHARAVLHQCTSVFPSLGPLLQTVDVTRLTLQP